ncbi:SDR family oxidoreductase [Arthrobacter crystallopoietes]|jgi:NAD(P)-dependent dehydrogenase (short-subunit alcohol dehydrogenase family)|uniref:3-oxoacyl-[acyl-carrier protein] reductase n=1 Tax=Crystallibacter crystallopoietes TaxID=37928 RepID=A0A1H1CUI2_9MICC|nr:SDR family oxidoreductase [Arthrobacter crystallopoietes]AUI50595.1 3-ketoacyl-ACP reductase [Arthrobacter crystallopoietes]SDQ67947.1 3-oxoacyl-[acyl-carrier protein] reductase [Arthrobacter crystallopoietes]
MERRFEGKTALVTGASRGIGLAVARELVEGGARVVITARGEEKLQEAVRELDGPAVGIAGKADDAEHRAQVFDAIRSRFGTLDFLVNNVGINPVYGPMMDLDDVAARKILEVNVIGALKMAQDAVSAGLRERRGAIVNIASIAGVTSSPGIGMYGVSKAAVLSLTRQLAAELAPDVRVNAVAPAAVKTNFARALYEGREAELTDKYPLRRLGMPEDVAGPVAFLLSDAAAWITGQTLVIDGGATLVTAE